jgi:cyclophilin family peptidyl-prolyl cis-trans isomerase
MTCGALVLWGSAASAQDDSAPTELVEAAASAKRQLEQLEVELAAIRAALRSTASTSAWLAQRIEQFSAQASALSMNDELNQLQGLSIRLADIEARRGEAQPAIDFGAQGYRDLQAAALAAVVATSDTQVLSQGPALELIRSQALVQQASLQATSLACDALIRDVCRLNAEVERVHGALAALRGELVDLGQEALIAPSWLASEPVVVLSIRQLDRFEQAESIPLGELILELRPDVAPRHVENFRRLVENGFYDGLTFHRVVPNFVVQGGDPLGTGMGGPEWQIPAEFNDLHHVRGTLSMARMGQWDTAGSQFFLCLDDWSQELDRKYTVFGKLLTGFATLNNIAELGSASGKPSNDIIIEIETAVLRKRRPSDVSDEP